MTRTRRFGVSKCRSGLLLEFVVFSAVATCAADPPYLAFPIGDGGKLAPHSALEQQFGSSINRQRQTGRHAHSILTSNDNRFALSADLGTDQIVVYRFDSQKGSLSPKTPPFAKSGTLTTTQTVPTLLADFKGDNREAEIVVHAKDRFLYVSNRGYDAIAVFQIGVNDGTLSFVQRVPSGGKIPRNFAIDPTGRWWFAANHQSNNIQLFHVNPDTGKLTAMEQISGIFDPVCVIFVPIDLRLSEAKGYLP